MGGAETARAAARAMITARDPTALIWVTQLEVVRLARDGAASTTSSRRRAGHATWLSSTTNVSTIFSRSYIHRDSRPAITAPISGATQNNHS
jgi:hypothetical protein